MQKKSTLLPSSGQSNMNASTCAAPTRYSWHRSRRGPEERTGRHTQKHKDNLQNHLCSRNHPNPGHCAYYYYYYYIDLEQKEGRMNPVGWLFLVHINADTVILSISCVFQDKHLSATLFTFSYPPHTNQHFYNINDFICEQSDIFTDVTGHVNI